MLENYHSIEANAKQQLLHLIKEYAVLSLGDYKLASGGKSSIFINCKMVTTSLEGMLLCGELLHYALTDVYYKYIGGMESGAIPLALSVVQHSATQTRGINGFYVRKQPHKATGKTIEGIIPPEAKVVVIDDVFTSGRSTLLACEEVEKAGARVVAVACLVDRLSGARELLEPRYLYRSVLTLDDILG